MSPITKIAIAATGLTALIDVVWMTAAGHSFAWASAAPLAATSGGLFALAWYYGRLRREAKIAAATFWTALLLAFSGFGAVASYLFATLNFPLKDAWFAAFDRALGLDWVALTHVVLGQGWLGGVATALYMSSLPLIALAIVWLGLRGHRRRLELFVTALIVSCLLVIALSAPLAAVGPYYHYGIDPQVYQAFAPVTLSDHLPLRHLLALREGRVDVLSLQTIQGIVVMPSFHTVISVLLILATRGVRWLAWPMLAVNVLILATIPFEGNHYFADMAAGAALALAVWAALARLARAPAGAPALRPAH